MSVAEINQHPLVAELQVGNGAPVLINERERTTDPARGVVWEFGTGWTGGAQPFNLHHHLTGTGLFEIENERKPVACLERRVQVDQHHMEQT